MRMWLRNPCSQPRASLTISFVSRLLKSELSEPSGSTEMEGLGGGVAEQVRRGRAGEDGAEQVRGGTECEGVAEQVRGGTCSVWACLGSSRSWFFPLFSCFWWNFLFLQAISYFLVGAGSSLSGIRFCFSSQLNLSKNSLSISPLLFRNCSECLYWLSVESGHGQVKNLAAADFTGVILTFP